MNVSKTVRRDTLAHGFGVLRSEIRRLRQLKRKSCEDCDFANRKNKEE